MNLRIILDGTPPLLDTPIISATDACAYHDLISGSLGFCKNIKKRTETLYQSFSPFMWNDSKNDTIHAFHFALGLSFYIGCIWVQNGCSRVQKRLGGCNTGLSFCYLLFRRNSHIPLLYTIIVLLCFSLLMGITRCSLVHKYSFA